MIKKYLKFEISDMASVNTYSSTKFCWGPIMDPGRQMRIQAMASAAVRR